MILIGIGSNLAASQYDSPMATAAAALAQLPDCGAQVLCRSRWYLSEPVPASDQPWYVNAVAVIESGLTPENLLAGLLALETRFGRRRSVANAARTLDLDLLDYDGRQIATESLVLPHPRLHERGFVLIPLAEIASQWRHPLLGLTPSEMLARLPPGQKVHAVGEGQPTCG